MKRVPPRGVVSVSSIGGLGLGVLFPFTPSGGWGGGGVRGGVLGVLFPFPSPSTGLVWATKHLRVNGTRERRVDLSLPRGKRERERNVIFCRGRMG